MKPTGNIVLLLISWALLNACGFPEGHSDLNNLNNLNNVNNANNAQCGDGVRTAGETCDGDDLGGQLCTDLGAFSGGTLACAADCLGYDTSGCVSGLTDDASMLLSGEVLAGIEITLDDDAVNSIWQQSELYVFSDVVITVDGRRHELPSTGLRLKGRWGSFRQLDGKAAFLLKFDKFVADRRFFGLEKLALNNMVQDPSMIHEQLGYRLFRGMNVPAPRAGYATVRVNGELYGLYATIESADNPDFLDRWFGGHDGSLYEGEYGTDLLDDLVTSFDQDNGADVGFSDLRELTNQLDAMTDPETFMTDVSQFIDLDAYLRFAATEIFLGHWDGYAWTRNNYFLYRRPGDGRWLWIPWGIDQTFVDYLDNWGGDGRLERMCLQSRPCRVALGAAFEQVIETAAALGLAGQTDVLRDRIRDAATADPRREYPIGAVADGITWTRIFLENRPDDVLARMSCIDPDTVDNDDDGASGCGFDCDDGDDTVYPGAPETCNGRDDDCDGLIDNHPDCPHCQEHAAPQGGTLLYCFWPLNYLDAEADCAVQGGHLASIHDASTQDTIAATALGIAGQNWWIGANDLDTEGTFTWTDGTPFDAAFWADGEPNNADGWENCAHLASWAGGRWNDIPCDYTMYYVCHVP
ncbi:CotH kinase family protein [Myxococcota bacterium]|nr:CotH kinase family protein [Myxococcota bacterium]MBU1511383.1 CotH kinase family protein [Myxococcota bacterium]